MDISSILSRCDHTLLRPDAVWAEVRRLCEEAVEFQTAAVCIPPCYVAQASDYLAGRIPVCTVIGFPNGYSSTAVKCFEAAEAIADGADELDVVANIGRIKAGEYRSVLEELKELRRICGTRVLKVIIETCLLTEEEKREMCRVVSDSGADYIKTSTGFSRGGAVPEDIRLMRECSAPHLHIKAAGGIASLEAAEELLRLGADRLGASRLVPLARALRDEEKAGQHSL